MTDQDPERTEALFAMAIGLVMIVAAFAIGGIAKWQ